MWSFILSSASLRQDTNIPYVSFDSGQTRANYETTTLKFLFIISFLNICVISFSGSFGLGLGIECSCVHFVVFPGLFFYHFSRLAFSTLRPPSTFSLFFCSHYIFVDVVCIKSTNSPLGMMLFLLFFLPLFPAFSVPVLPNLAHGVKFGSGVSICERWGIRVFSDALLFSCILCPPPRVANIA